MPETEARQLLDLIYKAMRDLYPNTDYKLIDVQELINEVKTEYLHEETVRPAIDISWEYQDNLYEAEEAENIRELEGLGLL